MLQADLKVTHKRNLLYRGYGTRIESVFRAQNDPSTELPIAQLFARFLQYAPSIRLRLQSAEVVDEDGKQIYVIKDVRGRPAESFGSKAPKALLRNKTEEVFFSEGVLYQPPANLDEYPTDTEELEQVPFSVRVNSRFYRFDEENHIHHRMEREQSEILSRSLGEFEVGLLAKLIPAELHTIRIGIESFAERSSNWFSGLLPPSVKTRFFLELDASSLYVLVEDESGGEKGQLPQFEGNILGAVDRALDELDLYVGLTEKITEKLKT